MSLNWKTADLEQQQEAVTAGGGAVRRQPVSEPKLRPEPRRYPTRVPPRIFRHLFQLAIVAALGCGSYWLFSRYVLQSVEVVGVSMLPTLHNSDHYLLNKWTYLLRKPRPSDIVVIRSPDDGKYSVKRIIACPGDSVRLKNGQVFVNGRELNEPYLAPWTPTYASEPGNGDELIICGNNQYFVLGDNRKNSEDSRTYGPVPRKNILGPVDR